MVTTRHREALRRIASDTRLAVCRQVGISVMAYDELHYDLAYVWFESRDYLEYTARVFMLSKIFHTWWNQQLTLLEAEFLIKGGGSVEDLTKAILSADIIPSRQLLRQMHNEGRQVLAGNSDLKQTKIYRHECNTGS